MKLKRLSSSVENSHGDDGIFRPQLTSMIDVMVILLIFLIQYFSAEGELITPAADLKLPLSSIDSRPERTITVQISSDEVMVDDQKIVPIKSFAGSDDFLIKPLFARMKEARKTAKTPKVMIQADRELPFNVIKRVAYTCSQAGFTDFAVLVMQEEK